MTEIELNAKEKKEHDDVIESVRAKLIADGNEVEVNKFKSKSSPVTYTKGDGTKGQYYPDVYTHKDSIVTKMFEVETLSSVNDDQAENQWKLYSKGKAKFYLVVPESKLEEAKNLAKKYKVEVEDYWFYEAEK